MSRTDTWDQSKTVDRDKLKQAFDEIQRERHDNNYGQGYYDYAPEPTIDEVWKRAEQNIQWANDRR